jgi:hypothetical protein
MQSFAGLLHLCADVWSMKKSGGGGDVYFNSSRVRICECLAPDRSLFILPC